MVGSWRIIDLTISQKRAVAIDKDTKSVYIFDMAAIRGDQLRGHLAGLILSALERGPAHGWGIARSLDQQAQGGLELKEGSLYRLEHMKLVAAQWEKQGNGRRGPKRRVYPLTAKGRRRLSEARAEWKEFVAVLGNLLGAPT